ncbi:PHD finger protein 1-like isoform X1 [Hypanus sabinus]|uniref:PHD finger protein 1-like isoform X1 n=2 Tax=Hypanus sabinus TaxID=79690 RepID=UPI0028C4B47E|nr:PHD finger protein 1-like isoform X1 [Hypanus sabinus]
MLQGDKAQAPSRTLLSLPSTMENKPSGRRLKARRDCTPMSKRRARGGAEGTHTRLWEGQDVLARWSDGLLYLGKIRKVDRWKHICLVRFEDNSEFWEMWKDIYPSALPGSEQVCFLCSDNTSSQHNLIVICAKCKQGYHQECHAPPIKADGVAPSSWICRSCVFAVATKKGGALKKGLYAKAMLAMKQALPYQLESLEWDSEHLTNQQQCYCYCGGPGEWNVKMLQCYRCQHWFHEACTQCLTKPLLYGDRFYLFLCSVCTGGPEYVKRLPLDWVDIAHLVLYHLTSCCKRKYFDFEREILAFANENWGSLLVGGLSSTTKTERYNQLLNTLNSHRERFVSGKEIKKKKCIFGLQERLPPPPPPAACLQEMYSKSSVPLLSPSRPPTRSVLEGLKKPKVRRPLRRRDPQDLYALKTRKARRLLQRAISQNVVVNPSSPNQAYRGSKGSVSACPAWENIERTPPKMMFASIQPSSNTVRSLESSSSSSLEYGDTAGCPTRAAGGGARLSDGEEGADPPEEEEEEEAEVDDEEEAGEEGEEEDEEECLDNMADSRSQCDSSDEDLPLSYFCSSVNSYFGAMGRLARGETVRILARRLTLDNKVQYLVEWGGSSMF